MKLPVRLRPEVLKDLTDAANWYDRERAGLGAEFANAAFDAFDEIAERPSSFPIVHKGARRALMKRFPYAIYFRADAQLVTIQIVVHTSRSPRIWKRRMR
jgi:plasmid stabilization system protein ParE